VSKDTYKGESLGKKIARAWFWVVVQRWLKDDFYTGQHLVLASREGGDVSVLKAMGVPPANIVAMELNAPAAHCFRQKHPDVRVYIGDVAELVNDKRFRSNVVCAHLDFCSWCTDAVVERAVRVARFGMRHNGVLSVGIMKGREQGPVRDSLRAMGAEAEELRIDRKLQRTWSRADKMAWERQETSSTRRWLLFTRITDGLLSPGPNVGVMPLGSVGYNSGKTPMVFDIFIVRRALTRRGLFHQIGTLLEEVSAAKFDLAYELAEWEQKNGHTSMAMQNAASDIFLRGHQFITIGERDWMTVGPEFGDPSPELAATMANAIETLHPTLSAADVLTVRRGRLAAWRAHATRGTYSEATA